MKIPELIELRLLQQGLADRKFNRPEDVVSWLGAVQSQDYRGGLWAIGMRTSGCTETDVEKAIAEKRIVRTWPMRGTLHFVAAADVRWMLKFLAPRILERAGGRHRQLELDDRTFQRSGDLFAKALQGGKQVTRSRMYELLEAKGISTKGQRGIHILWKLAQDGLLCHGAREGKQPTFVLLEEWLPGFKTMERDAALAELAKRYFIGHGPATLQDFVWWSGLPVADARKGLDLARHLHHKTFDGHSCWMSPNVEFGQKSPHTAHFLPAYDEYLIGYKDRSAALDTRRFTQPFQNPIFSPTILLDGKIAGAWTRTIKKNVSLSMKRFRVWSGTETRSLETAAQRYCEFLP